MSGAEDSAEYIIIPEHLSRCKCCFDDNNLRSMWDVYANDGEQEIYGEMIGECFAISWESHEQGDLICEMCVLRLREALTFKRGILATHELLQEAIDSKDVEQFPAFEIEPDIKEEWIEEMEDIYNNGSLHEEFQDVEYLDDEEKSSSPKPIKHKWPKKKKKSERLARYKQYSTEDMRLAIAAVRSGEMTSTIAAITYGVPKKTLTAKSIEKEIKDDDEGKEASSEKQYKLIKEIKNILKYTNAIPFKTKTTRYYCAYCSTDGPIFEDGDSLRLHTKLEHEKERLRGVEKFMRPQWMNEIVKLDIEGLHCTACRVRLPDWNKMFVHFANTHNIEFDQAYTRVIPYALTSQLKCVLCKEGFHNYGHVDSHMNHHYSNYICHQCGDTFLAASRFDKHLKVHKIGSYPCELCDKVFTLEKYRTKHKNLVHDQKSMVKCLYCSERFVGLFQRHVHVTEHHKDKVKVYTCELCGNCYTWKTYFLAHMRRRHGTERKHQCKHCDKSFLMKYELRNHMVRHTDEKFLCGLCGKSFKRMITLKKHCLTHEEFGLDEDYDEGKEASSEKQYKLIKEIKNILKYTNAIPFKTKTTRYYCAYCSTDGPIFEDGDSLRLHTKLEHEKERLRGVEKFMRPQWMNEIVKLDIEGLHCTACRVRLPDWNKMFVHFANTHNIEFDQAYTRVIPYALTSQLKCVLCKEGFHNYGHVDSHMNHHYSNYICHQCGDTFLAASRFDKHLKVHKIGSYPCELCDKVFTLEKYRTKHKNLVHDQKSMVKCLYCSERFVGLFQRHVHVTEHHKDKVKVYTCELCGNCYTWKTYFLAHMRRRHGTERKHQCKHCDKSFLMKYELRNHMVRHTDEKFLCGLCGKSFKRMITLKKHCLTHEEFGLDEDCHV